MKKCIDCCELNLLFSVVGMQQIASKNIISLSMCIVCTTSKGKDSAKAHNEV